MFPARCLHRCLHSVCTSTRRPRGEPMANVTLNSVVKQYDGGVTAVNGLDLEIRDREFMVLVGPSGCGKSTTLRMIAGLESITGGTMSIGTQVVNDVPPKDRNIAMVFQNYALYPHMSVFENMAFGLRIEKLPKARSAPGWRKPRASWTSNRCCNESPRPLRGTTSTGCDGACNRSRALRLSLRRTLI